MWRGLFIYFFLFPAKENVKNVIYTKRRIKKERGRGTKEEKIVLFWTKKKKKKLISE